MHKIFDENSSDNKKVYQAVILAGGYGTRLKPFTDTMPKPMYPFYGKPFLEYLIEQVRSFGIIDVVLLLGYLPEKIEEYFGDGSKWGVQIRYSTTPVEYETGLRIKSAADMLHDSFLLMYCDNYCPIDFDKLQDDFDQNDSLLQLSAYINRDGYTKDNFIISEDGKVEVYDKRRVTPGLQGVDIGYAIIAKEVIDLLPDDNHNFESVVYPKLVEQSRLFATVTEHRYYSVGSWERIELTKAFLDPSRKFVFLDRDGTLNVRLPQACYIEKPSDFEWLDGAREAVKKLNDNGYTVILVSNQPGIARGNLTEETLNSIHLKMQDDLACIGAHVDAIYYCPHNWDDGCLCRKPKPGMLYDAQKDFSIDLTKSILIGDDDRDIEAGMAARCRCFQVSEEYSLAQAVDDLLKGTEE